MPHNAKILVESKKIIKQVLCSTAKAECAGLFRNGKKIFHLHIILEEMRDN